jgi:cytochrome c-type biogenesis protein CcsB
MEFLFDRIALVFYFLAAVSFIANLSWSREPLRWSGPVLLGLAVAAQAVALVVRTIEVGFPVTRFEEGLEFLGWTLSIVFLLLHRIYGLPVIGAVIAPAAFALTLIGVLFASGATELPTALRSAWLPVHVTLAFLGNAVLALAFATSLVYLFEDSRLKSKHPRLIPRFPSLEKLDKLNHRLISWGFPLLTLGILSGAVWAYFAWGRFWSWEAREIWSLFTWALYAILLHGRVTIGWRGRRAATLTIIGFVVVLMSFVSVNLLFPGRHAGTFGS